MGCASSVCALAGKKRKIIPQISVFVPCLWIPLDCDMKRALIGSIPKDLAHRITSLRNQIALVAADTGGSAISELTKGLEEYLSLLIGLTKEEYELQDVVEFRWKELYGGRKEICAANSWFELLCVLHMMAMLTLMETNVKLISRESNLPEMQSADEMSEAVDLLLKAAGYLNFCVGDVLLRLPTDVKKKLPLDMQESVLEAISHQALAQATEIQLGLAVQNRNATLSVKRRLACEQLGFFAQAHCCLSQVYKESTTAGKKQLLFLKWKHVEAKAAAYYYHGLILDNGTEPSSHVGCVCCLLAAQECLAESKKACLSFCLADPVTRESPPWGAMRRLRNTIPETASKKSQMYSYLSDQDNRDVQNLPDLPEFQLSLKPDDYELPQSDPAWDSRKWIIHGQTLKEHLNDDQDT